MILAPIWRCRLWRKRGTGRVFFYERAIYGNSAILREVKKVIPGIYRQDNSPPWFVDMESIEQHFERKGW